MKSRFLSFIAVLVVASVTVVASENELASDVSLDGVKCIVAPRDAQASKSADYKEGKVYFCCGGCAGKFAAAEKKFATQANRQLVQTKQYKQTGCPISGGGINPETMIKVDGTEVAFCCGNCKAKVESAEGKEQSKLVFGEKAFKKAYKKADKS
jgi:YHS domain-containing protein